MAGLSADKASSFEGEVRTAIQKTLKRHNQETGIFVHGMRSATVHWARAAPVLSSCFRKFWETGVVAGNATDMKDLGDCGYGRVNPLFAISSAPSGEFAVHYGTDPLLGFHLASAFDDESSSEQDLRNKVVTLAKIQFLDWCTVLKNHFSESSSKSREGIHLSMEAHGIEAFGLDRPLDRGLFDIIETSNLADHVGMLNVLPAIVPLLSRRVTSVMFTNTLLRATEDVPAALPALLCSDVATMSLILGLAPTAYLLPYTVDAVGLEAALDLTASKNTGRQSQYHMGISWRIASFGDSVQVQNGSASYDRLCFQFDQLARYFFQLYVTMFSYEDVGSMLGSMMRQMRSPLSVDLRHYNRMTFVIFLSLARNRVQTEWNSFMTRLLDMIQTDRRLLVGSNSVQELYLLLHLFGLFTSDVLQQPPRNIGRTPYGQPRTCLADTGLLGREDVPPIVYLALTVPRDKLAVFTKDKDPRGTPGLHVSVWGIQQGFDNSYFAIQCFFGQLKARSDDCYACDVIPDNRGWQGLANLIVTCAVPTWGLLLGPKAHIRVALTISSTPSTCHYLPKLGIHMSVFECGLDDLNLRILTEPPGMGILARKLFESTKFPSL
ncbi:hypothetical protein N7513_001793 [Penicillium frequentans]|nr:hypothetical protein N7513_001793 [Penicillium glabrum]